MDLFKIFVAILFGVVVGQLAGYVVRRLRKKKPKRYSYTDLEIVIDGKKFDGVESIEFSNVNDTPEEEREYYDTREGWDGACCEHCHEPFWYYERDEACERCEMWEPGDTIPKHERRRP